MNNIVKRIYRVAFGLAGLILAVIILTYLIGYRTEVGILVISFFLSLLIGIRGVPSLKGFAYTIWVFFAVAMAMLYPDYLIEVRGYNTERLIVPLIQLIMFGMGTSLSIEDFAGVMKMPKGVLTGLACQFTIMPLLGISIALIFGFPAEIAAGIVLIGSSPSGVSSNVMVFLAKGNLALSVTLTSFATLVAPLMTPLLMQVFAGRFVPIEFYSMMISIFNMIILPIIAGLIFNKIFRGRAKWLHDIMPGLAMAANVLIIAIIVAAGRDSILSIGLLLLLAAIIHNAAGYLLGYWACRFLKLGTQDSRTIAFEVGMQNGGMAAGIATEMGRAATMGLFPAIFGTWMDISGSVLANWWRDKTISGEEKSTAELGVAVELNE